MSQRTTTQKRIEIERPSGRTSPFVLAVGLATYLLVLAVGLMEAGIRADVAAKAVSVLAVLSILFPLAALVLFMMELVEGVVIGTPVAWYRYMLSVIKKNWMAIVGSALLIIALMAVLAAATI